MDELIEEIKKSILVSGALELELRSAFEALELSRKEHFLRQGQYNVPLGFVKSGVLRCYNMKEGKEIINDFFFENTFLTDFGSFFKNLPARQNFEAIENTSLFKISQQQLFKLSERFPELRTWGTKMSENLMVMSLEKQSILHSERPEERYKRLVAEKPEMLQRIPLQYIASYLGITQVHLSRIRSKKKL